MKELEDLKLLVDDFVKSANEFIEKMKENEKVMSELNEKIKMLTNHKDIN